MEEGEKKSSTPVDTALLYRTAMARAGRVALCQKKIFHRQGELSYSIAHLHLSHLVRTLAVHGVHGAAVWAGGPHDPAVAAAGLAAARLGTALSEAVPRQLERPAQAFTTLIGGSIGAPALPSTDPARFDTNTTVFQLTGAPLHTQLRPPLRLLLLLLTFARSRETSRSQRAICPSCDLPSRVPR